MRSAMRSAIVLVALVLLAGCSSASPKPASTATPDTSPSIAELSRQAVASASSAAARPVAAGVTVTAAATNAPATPSPTFATATPERFTLTGSIAAPSCGGGYRIEGASVTVKNEAGTIIASSSTGLNEVPAPTPIPAEEQAINAKFLKDLIDWNGHGVPLPTLAPEINADINAYDLAVKVRSCRTTFTAAVPRAQFYALTVGTHGGPAYSFDQMVRMGWKLILSLAN